MFGRFFKSVFILRWVRYLPILSLVCFAGCGNFFSEKATEIQAKAILNELSRIDTITEPNIPIPKAYTEPPVIIEQITDGKPDAKLLYFCRYHTSDKLLGLVNAQFAIVLRDDKGKTSVSPDYVVSSNPATNQLIVRCPTRQDAEQVLDFLEYVDVPPIQVKIDCLISEVYADVTMDWETTLQIENVIGEGISLGGKDSLPAFPGAAIRDVARSTFGLKVGVDRGKTGHRIRALVDLLVSRGYLKILMNPTLEVVNGKTAEISTKEHVPLDEITNVQPITGTLTTTTRYEDVIDSLKITPHVYVDGYIGLETVAVIGSKATPEGVKQIPIVTERRITNSENRIRIGDSLVIGGITKTEKRSVIRGVPFLKDIPLLGILFSSKDFEERGKEVLFILTPSISTDGVSNEKTVESLRKLHKKPEYKLGLSEVLTDPFGVSAYTELIEQKAAEAEFERIKAELDKAEAKGEVGQIKGKLLKTAEDVLLEKQKAAKVRAELGRMKSEAEKAKKEAEEAKAEAEKTKLDAEKAKLDAERTKADADKAKAEAEKVKLEAEKAKDEKTKNESDNQSENQQNKSEDKKIDNEPNK